MLTRQGERFTLITTLLLEKEKKMNKRIKGLVALFLVMILAIPSVTYAEEELTTATLSIFDDK